jgi:hypothetical protein
MTGSKAWATPQQTISLAPALFAVGRQQLNDGFDTTTDHCGADAAVLRTRRLILFGAGRPAFTALSSGGGKGSLLRHARRIASRLMSQTRHFPLAQLMP